ncbi:MAG TPA: patatin-like phospholipase family protein [Nitrospiraceae bacterium]|jgi:predicted patatin/cPLA2 family phospholipase|nr:patatin-like phospholipase family protein [Nitrospiraceae bacterium]
MSATLPEKTAYYAVAQEMWEALRQRASGSAEGPAMGLVVQGGGMRGIYCMGVLAALEEMGFTACFDHVAGASAGALTAAHFITGQARYGVETYVHHLSNRRFVHLLRVRKQLDVDYLINYVVREVRPFKVSTLAQASTTLHITLTDARDASAHYVTNKTPGIDLWEAFRATAAAPILHNRFVRVEDRWCLDGSLSDPLPIRRVVECGCRYILVILNKPLWYRSKPVRGPLRTIAALKIRHYSSGLKQALFDENLALNQTLDLLSENKGCLTLGSAKILAIAPSHQRHLVKSTTTNAKRLWLCALRARADAWRAFGQILPTMDNPFKTADT